jgi:Arc/MetJ-type ribon-helix-helix transcriptional regulator
VRTPVTLRLDKATRLRIAHIARRRGTTASEVIRRAIAAWADDEEAATAPFDAMADLIGVVRGGNPHRSSQSGRQFARLLAGRREAP